MLTTISISISIFTVGGFRDVQSGEYQDYFSPRNIDFQIDLTLDCSTHFQNPYHMTPKRVQRIKDSVDEL